MSKDRAKSQEDWEEEPGEDSYEDEYEEHPRGRRRHRRDDDEHDRPRRRRGPWSCLFIGCLGAILLIVLVAVASVVMVANNVPLPGPVRGIGGGGNSQTYTLQNSQPLPLSNIKQIQVHNQVGDVSIMVDPTATAPTVTTVKKVKAASSDDARKEFGRISVQAQADSSTDVLEVNVLLPDTNGGLLSNGSDAVDVTVRLPSAVNANTGTLLTLNVDTSVGNILVSGLNGILMVKDSFGNVTMHQAMLADGSHLETGTGNVTFDGTLDTTSSANTQPRYKIQAEKGNVDVTLPATTNVTLDANVNVGNINSAFAINVTSTDGSPSYYGPLIPSTTPPSAVLVLDVSSGNINLHKA